MSKDLIINLINEYKETERCLLMGIDWLNESDYAKGKLDLIKIMINDLEKLLKEVN